MSATIFIHPSALSKPQHIAHLQAQTGTLAVYDRFKRAVLLKTGPQKRGQNLTPAPPPGNDAA